MYKTRVLAQRCALRGGGAVLAVAAAVVLASSAKPCSAQQVAASASVDSNSAASASVQEALYQEIYGRNDQRQAMLADALATQPDSDAARWHLGQVRVGDDWRTLDDVALEALRDPLLAEYAERRAACEDTAAGHEQLARWCRRQGLDARAGLEWQIVLKLDSANEAARMQLGLVDIDGRFVTRDQLDAEADLARDRRRADRHWRPVLAGYRRAILAGTSFEREQAVAALDAIEDPGCVPMLEELFLSEGGELAQIGIAVLSDMNRPEATRALAWQATEAEDELIRRAATEQLESRSLYEYVPGLLDRLEAPIEAEFTVQVDGTGNVNLRRWVHREGREESTTQVYDESLFQFNHVASVKRIVAQLPGGEAEHYRSNMDQRMAMQQQITAQAAVAATAQQQVVAAAEAEVAALNEEIELRNSRIMAVLEATTGESGFAEPIDWWQWWDEYNMVVHAEDRPDIEQYGWQHVSLDYAPPTTKYRRMSPGLNHGGNQAADGSVQKDPEDESFEYQEGYVYMEYDWSLGENRFVDGNGQPLVTDFRYVVGEPEYMAQFDYRQVTWRYSNGNWIPTGRLAIPNAQFTSELQDNRYDQVYFDLERRNSGTNWGYISCFVAGTPVWTEQGLRSIEEIRPGDRVLAQDVETGELVFRFVTESTVRPSAEVVAVVAQRESFVGTPGHLFWANGEGWKMACDLESGDVLHGIDGASFVSEVVPQEEPQPVYNLVVDEHHNYFIGESRILVHDVTLREPTRAVVPGLVSE